MINSTGRNIPSLMRGRTYNPAFMNPTDLAALDLAPGDAVEIRSAYDAVVGIVDTDADLQARGRLDEPWLRRQSR